MQDRATLHRPDESAILRVLDELNAAGVPDRDIFAVVATGSHRLATREDMEALAKAISLLPGKRA